MEEEGKRRRHLSVPVPADCQKSAVAAPASQEQHVEDSRAQPVAVGFSSSTSGSPRGRHCSLPLVDIHHLLGERGQQVALVHLQGADVQHGQVSLQLLQQGAAAGIPELWDRKGQGLQGFPLPPKPELFSLKRAAPNSPMWTALASGGGCP